MDLFNYSNDKKGVDSTVLVIGGSEYYTGAPFFSSMASLRLGCDLVYVLTDKTASVPLKTLLPEAVVSIFSYDTWILDKVDVCVFGVGLGRPSEDNLEIIKRVLKYLDQRNIFIVVDGDGLRYNDRLEISFLKNVIYTPNVNEAHYVTAYRNHYSIYKGKTDIIQSCNYKIEVADPVCEKRCGGQGDILAGVVSSLICKLQGEYTESNVMKVLESSSKILRHVASLAYKKYGISLITRDILNEIPEYARLLKNESF